MYWNTVTPFLQDVLRNAMNAEVFHPFRLVGGTSLSLQIGHRKSVDIDLFTDFEYGSLDFEAINTYFREQYTHVSSNDGLPVSFGRSWYVGNVLEDLVKVDVYYTDTFIRPVIKQEGVRMATIEDIIAMKLEVVGNSGRKKDFWDLHSLHNQFAIPAMINLHQERYPYSHTPEELRSALINFDDAENDFDPVCLLGKQWPLIKLDFVEWLDSE
jgi:Nucleotidyl transferase AbiEii toxin, Type IV TA system